MWWKGFPVGHLFLFLWVCFWLQKAALGHLFPLPFGASSLIPLGPIFFPHWKKCSFSCRSVFGLKQHWPLESIGTGFSAPVVLFLPKSNTGKRCSCGCVFFGMRQHWTRCETEKISGWAGEKFAGWKKKIEELLLILCENFALQISRLEDLSICVFAYQKVWGCEDEKICRCEEDTKLKKKGVKMRGWDYVRNWKCEVKNINRKVTVCKNVLYIKIIAKEKI